METMDNETLILAALQKFMIRKDKCHLELLKEVDITELKIKQLHYLEIINQYKQLSYGEFARILHISRPSVTHIVNRLIDLKAVSRRQCEKDGRIYYVELSEKGKKIVSFKALEQKRLAKQIRSALDDREVTRFVRLLNKIAAI